MAIDAATPVTTALAKLNVLLESLAKDLALKGIGPDETYTQVGCSHRMMLREKRRTAIAVNVSPELLPAVGGESQRAYRQHGKSTVVLPARTRFA